MASSQRKAASFNSIAAPDLTVQNGGADVVVPAGSGGTTIASASGGSVPNLLGDVDEFWFDVSLRISAGLSDGGEVPDHVHGMAGHVHSTPDHQHGVQVFGGLAETPGVDVVNTSGGVLGKGGGGDFSQATTAAGAGDTGGPSPSDTDPAGAGSITLMGPFNLHIVFVDSLGVPYEIAAEPFWYVRTGRSIRKTITYPFGWIGSDYSQTPATVKIDIENLGASDITIDNAFTKAVIYSRSLTYTSPV